MQHDGLWCAFENLPMGASADYIAATRDVSRADQDRFALESHVRAVAAATAGRFAEEIVPVVISGRKGDVRIDRDEGPRADSSLEVLGRLKPSFRRQRHGDGRQLVADQRRRGRRRRRE